MNTNKILRYFILTGVFLLTLIPLFVSNHLFFPFITGKNFAFRIIVEIITGLWLILVLRDKEALPRSSKLFQALAIFIGLIFISDLLSPNVFKSFWSNYERMEGWVTLVHLFALFVVLSGVMTKKLWQWLFRASIAVSLILFLYALFQLAGKLDIHQGSVRVDATLGNSSYLGGYMLFHIFLALYLLVSYLKTFYGKRDWNWFWPAAYIFVSLADIFTLFETATRGSEIGLAAGLTFFAAGLCYFERKNKTLRNIGAGVLITIVLLGGFLVVERHSNFVLKNTSLSRLGSFADQLLSFDIKTVCQGELRSRCLLWPMAWRGVEERPVFGWGQESFNYVFNKYYDSRMFSQEQWFDRTHNVFFDWLIAGGFLGLLAYLSLFVLAVYYLWRKGSPFSLAESSLLTGLFIAYFFHNLTVFDNITSYILFIFLLAWLNDSVGERTKVLERQLANVDAGVRNRILIPIISAATVFVVYFVNVPSLLASYELIQALSSNSGGPSVNLKHYKKAFSYGGLGDSEIREQLIQTTSQAAVAENVDLKIKNDFFNFTKEQVDIQLNRTPKDARYFLFAGSFFGSFGDFDNALKTLTKARELSPNKQTIAFSLGSVYLNKKDFKNAVAVFKQAFESEQSFGDARRLYALSLVYDGQIQLSDEILKPLPLETILSDQRFIVAYYSSGYFYKALASVNFLIQKEPANIQYYLSRAAILVSLGQRNAAIADLNKISEINPAAKAQADNYISQIRAGKGI